MPKIIKAITHDFFIFQNLFKAYSGHLLITTNLFFKFQGSNSNISLDIKLAREKCPNLQRAITHETFSQDLFKS